MVIPDLLFLPNSGQYLATGSLKSIKPSSARRWMHAAVTALVTEKVLNTVFGVTGRRS